MTNLNITCPHCAGEIELTEALAAPLVAEMEGDFLRRMRAKDEQVKVMESRLNARELALRNQEELAAERLAAKEAQLRDELGAAALRTARQAVHAEIDDQKRVNAELVGLLKAKEEAEAAMNEERARMRRQEAALRQQQADLAVEVENRVTQRLPELEEAARLRAEQLIERTVSEKDILIDQLKRRVNDLQLNIHQGSQQIQGAANETLIRGRLQAEFPTDGFDKVATGSRGGDLLQTVVTPFGARAGVILWEVKQAKTFQRDWLGKLKQDQARASADLAVLVAPVLPEGCTTFMHHEGHWIVTPALATDLAEVLRKGLITLAQARQASTGRETKAEKLYDYLMGPLFRAKVTAMLEAALALRDSQQRQREALSREWSRTDVHLGNLRDACLGMQTDLVAIAGDEVEVLEAERFVLLEGEE